ncbi:MAG: ABC transporter substrate-binding protein [Oscillospiraceae bacterium]
MRQKIEKITALLILLAAFITGCSSGRAPEGAEEGSYSGAVTGTDIVEGTERVKFVREDILDSLEIAVSTIHLTEHNGTFYCATEDGHAVAAVYPECELVYDASPFYIKGLAAVEDGLWVLETSSNFEDAQAPLLKKLSYEWDELLAVEINGEENISGAGVVADSDGYAYVETYSRVDTESEHFWYTSISVVSPDGEVSEIGFDYAFSNMFTGSDGEVFGWAIGPSRLYRISREKGSVDSEDLIEIPSFGAKDGTSYVCDGVNGAAATLCDSSGIYSLYEDGSVELIAGWTENKLANNTVFKIFTLSDGSYMCAGMSNGFGVSYSLFILTQTDSAEAAKETITLALFQDAASMNYASAITEFNAESDRYYVEAINYCEDRSFYDALTLLNTQIISGSGPDIICFDGRISPERYAESGWLYDLYGFMEDDAELKADDLVLTELMENNGGLYAVAADFMLMTWYTSLPELSGCVGWTYSEYKTMAEALPNGTVLANASQESFLKNCLRCYLPDAVDWEAASCSFNTDEFIEILELSSMAQEDEALDARLGYLTISSPLDLAKLEERMGPDVNIIGWPTADGGNGTVVYFYERFGILSQSGCPEGAWEFIKTVLKSQRATQLGSWSPVLKSAVYENIDILQNPGKIYEDSEITTDKAGSYYIDGALYEGAGDPREQEPIIAQEQADRFLKMLDDVKYVYAVDPNILTIIMEESQAFFAGDKTAEETAKLIQSRASIYISEQQR